MQRAIRADFREQVQQEGSEEVAAEPAGRGGGALGRADTEPQKLARISRTFDLEIGHRFCLIKVG